MKSISILLFLVITLNVYGQRQDVNSLTPTQQSNTACNIKALLDNYHEDLIHRHTALTIHTTNNFFVWHKFYVHKMEIYLHSNFSQSLFESNPLPYWSPLNQIPNSFFNSGTGGNPICDRAANVPDNLSPPHGASGHVHEPHTATFTPLQFQNINTTTGGLSGFFNINPFSVGSQLANMSTKQFYTNVSSSNTWLCQYTSRNILTSRVGPGGGHHGNVHLAIGGCLGGTFHEAPGSTLFSVWHSYLDKVWHDWECNCGGITGSDLYIPDRENDDDMTATTHNGIDMGYEPNEAPSTYPMWVSEDIWLRNQQDGIVFQVHQNPEYSTGKKVYVYVRVRNRGCVVSSGSEQLNLYWAKANTSLDYPNAWNGSNTLCTNPSGGQIGIAQTITALQPDGYKIYVFEFYLPKPSDYTCVGDINHFCLLARITDPTKPNDGMTFAETTDIYSNVRNNNNIAWKNISILDNLPDLKLMSTNILVKRSNLCKNDDCLNKIVFNVPHVNAKHTEEETNILKYSKIVIKLNPQLYEAYKQTKTKIKGGKLDSRGNVTIFKNNVEIPLLLQKEVENYMFQVNISKPKKLPKYLPDLKFDIIQMAEGKIIGGQRFVLPINKYKPIEMIGKK